MPLFDLNKPLYALTVGEFVQLNEKIHNENQKQLQKMGSNDDQIITSIKGLAKFLHCSVPTAQKFKNKFPEIFHQTGRIFLVCKSDILSMMK
jgi:hypothetical protein